MSIRVVVILSIIDTLIIDNLDMKGPRHAEIASKNDGLINQKVQLGRREKMR